MIYIANDANSAVRQAQEEIEWATTPRVGHFGYFGTAKEVENALSLWNRNEEARVAVAEALGLKLSWLVKHNVPTVRLLLVGIDNDLRYLHAVSNALADIVRDTTIIQGWRQYRLGEDHRATAEALRWHETASALQKLADSHKKDPKTVRDYGDVDLPEFELTPSWMYLSGPPNRRKSRKLDGEPFVNTGAVWW